VLLRHGERNWNRKNLSTRAGRTETSREGAARPGRGGEFADGARTVARRLHTPVLRRAISTAQLGARRQASAWIPVRARGGSTSVTKGALQGKDKDSGRAEFGEDQFMHGAFLRSPPHPPPPPTTPPTPHPPHPTHPPPPPPPPLAAAAPGRARPYSDRRPPHGTARNRPEDRVPEDVVGGCAYLVDALEYPICAATVWGSWPAHGKLASAPGSSTSTTSRRRGRLAEHPERYSTALELDEKTAALEPRTYIDTEAAAAAIEAWQPGQEVAMKVTERDAEPARFSTGDAVRFRTGVAGRLTI